MTDQYDLFEGRRRRDAGIAKVEAPDPIWSDLALRYIIDFIPSGMELTNQAIERVILRHGCPRPRHHNCWGGLFLKAKRRKVLLELPGQVQATRVASHARKISNYRRT